MWLTRPPSALRWPSSSSVGASGEISMSEPSGRRATVIRSWMSKAWKSSFRGCTRPHRPGPSSSSRVVRERKGGSKEK